jgi:hypothetical protein
MSDRRNGISRNFMLTIKPHQRAGSLKSESSQPEAHHQQFFFPLSPQEGAREQSKGRKAAILENQNRRATMTNHDIPVQKRLFSPR